MNKLITGILMTCLFNSAPFALADDSDNSGEPLSYSSFQTGSFKFNTTTTINISQASEVTNTSLSMCHITKFDSKNLASREGQNEADLKIDQGRWGDVRSVLAIRHLNKVSFELLLPATRNFELPAASLNVECSLPTEVNDLDEAIIKPLKEYGITIYSVSNAD